VEAPVIKTPPGITVGLIVLALIWTPLQGYLLARYTDAALPYWDSTITVLSLLAQWMMARMYLENWVLWIAVDVLGIGVYQAKGLYVTAGLYAVFLVMAAWGLVAWRRGLSTARNADLVSI
jgi:nicotinamide mononucleotide transporter